jgi:CubicO group peptidase (beta-lactamase class C family)
VVGGRSDRAGIAAARSVLDRAVADRIFPAAVVEMGDAGGVLWRQAFGTLSFADPTPARADTVFDLASLTKPIATTSLILDLEHRQALDLREPLATFFQDWRGVDREGVTVQDLLEHASGLAARLVDAPPEGRREFEHDICTMRLEYVPRSQSVYTDLGFILLGFIVTDRGRAPLDQQFDAITSRLGKSDEEALAFGVDDDARRRTAPTLPMDADKRRGRTLVAEVHDNYAHLLGGAAGHAGLFGTAGGVGGFARAMLRGARGDATLQSPFARDIVARATAPSAVPGSSRALGWDTMLITSSCGAHMSGSAFGHVGFTGTSLWIDPVKDRYFVLLANRACGGGTLDEMRNVRRMFHDALAAT